MSLEALMHDSVRLLVACTWHENDLRTLNVRGHHVLVEIPHKNFVRMVGVYCLIKVVNVRRFAVVNFHFGMTVFDGHFGI